MDSHHWHRVKPIFEEAVALPPEERAAFLDRACQDAPDLRRDVLALLAAHADETPFLDEPVPMDALLLLSTDDGATNHVGARIGPYRLAGELGQGGMGSVYLAERADGAFHKRVAVKLVRAGRHRDDLIQRFRHERQILASLKHPHIARLLDGGVTEEGLPYLVMEYVEGVPIDQFCDRHHHTTRQRLALFRTVCEAVQYAHQSLVIHRDLKPSNILVTDDGKVKLLDFGIAKLLDEEASDAGPATQTGLRAMTPEYASPEQVRGAAITTASDVYALGVILYELLTGQRPYTVRGLTPSQVEEVICRQDPPRPSTAVGQAPHDAPERLRRRLQGDLDNIVLKALHKEPGRRYASVAALSEDVRRHLEQLPVLARPDTIGYRISKFVRRHTAAVIATALVVLALVGGIIATAYQARVAQQRFDDVRALANTILFDLHDDIRSLPGATPARRTLVTHALTYLDKLNREAGHDPSLQLELAEAYERIGRLQGDPHYTNLGDLAGTLDSYQKALTLREELWRRDTTNRAIQHALAKSYGHLAVAKAWSNASDTAIVLSRHALTMLAPLIDAMPNNLDVQHDAGRIQSELGWWMIFGTPKMDGLAHVDTALQMLEAIAPRQPDNEDLQLHLWRAFSYQIDGLRFTGQHQAALDLLEAKGLPHLHAMAGRWPIQPRVQYGLHVGYDYLGEMHQALGDLERAIPAYEEAARYAEAMIALDSTNRKGHEAQARAYLSLGYGYAALGRLDDAQTAYHHTIEVRQMLYEQNPDNAERGGMLGGAYRYLCRALLEGDRLDEALEPCYQGVQIQEKTVEADEAYTTMRSNLGSIYTYTARLHRALAERLIPGEARRNHLQEALAWYERGVATLNRVKQEHGPDYAMLAWEVHPDSLAAEHAAFAQTLSR